MCVYVSLWENMPYMHSWRPEDGISASGDGGTGVMMWVLGTKFKPSGRSARALIP